MTEPIPLTSSPQEDELQDTIALCLSGGGYRAMMYHLGTLWYLRDAGLLARLARISSVSGGSITSGMLGLKWNAATRDAAGFQREVVQPIRRMASTTIDVGSILRGVLLPGPVSERIVARYKKVLYGDATLQELPDAPRFVINATNVQTGSLFRFSKSYIGDYRIGRYPNPRTLLAEAVAASSAFPPLLSPVRLSFPPGSFSMDSGPLNRPPFNTNVMLTDGGVYDNMGIETAWKRCKTVLVSDAGAVLQPEEDPHADWGRHSYRVNSMIDSQVRSLRKRGIIYAFRQGDHHGAYWGMWTDPAEYPAPSKLSLPADRAVALARTPTRLNEMPDDLQNRLINFGYGMAERAVRSFFDTNAFAAEAFPCTGGI